MKINNALLYSLAFLSCFGWGTQAKSAETLESGMKELAKTIGLRSSEKGSKTIAIYPFTHADGSCSEMSNYLVDELLLSIFVEASGLQFVERSQLAAVS